MSKLTTKEKLKKVLELCEEHNITPYQIGKDTDLNKSGIQRIFNGEVANPRPSTVQRMLEYVESRIAHEKYGKSPKTSENIPTVDFPSVQGNSIQSIVAGQVVKSLQPFLQDFQKDHDAIFRSLTDNNLDLDEIKDSLEDIKENLADIKKTMNAMHDVMIPKK